ncbi:hypothetical protein L2E82_10480 [Cichorium intybus]|uniref:Uncharacterized protein n=1 Tax=Cichorium intybus TaxID=13427 RepID=A0ACB9GAP0_CICIN|nr:hypothetical protein L2E82_10480 [Cichorium intybus]
MSSSRSSESIDWNSLATGVDRVLAYSFYNRRSIYRHKRIFPSQTVNWELTKESGILEHLQDWLVLREFGYRIGLYTQEESEVTGFGPFHRRANYTAKESFSPADYRSTISSTWYHENTFKQLTDAPLKYIALGGGHFVTCLAHSYGLLLEYNISELTVIPPIPFSPSITTSRDVIYIDDGITSVERMPFPVLRDEPSSSRKRPQTTTRLPRGLSPETIKS